MSGDKQSQADKIIALTHDLGVELVHGLSTGGLCGHSAR